MSTIEISDHKQVRTIRQYYRWQSKIYDATRWSFLFGRNLIIKCLPLDVNGKYRILEVGCGTGHNLRNLALHFPNARITGLDASADMLAIARSRTRQFPERIQLVEKPYALGEEGFREQYDLVLFSYSLTMINPQWEELLQQACKDLKPGGFIAVVDFHDSRFNWFKRHMGRNHVRMDGHLLPELRQLYKSVFVRIFKAYAGAWEYVLFVGRK
ncbi:MAG: class I SAM-dependent methyltransferase [Saprospiraceae bacterium]|nr:class I SAM-dependent methyltransferase [Saprospiraceae bacterium]